MTRARSQIIDREEGGYYHLLSRCVRRSMLCGADPVTGRDLAHRREWIEDLALDLTQLFTVHVIAYAVMSNHYHITVNYRPQERLALSDEEVARRWRVLYRSPGNDDAGTVNSLQEPGRIEVLRDRLGDLSWYMRHLNETIARRANLEDDCTGRFWQGRFKAKGLHTSRAVWACMAYDDLNPERARISDQQATSYFTSLQRRLEEASEMPERFDQPMAPLTRRAGMVVSAPKPAPRLELTLREYCAHVDWIALATASANTQTDRIPAPEGDAASWLALMKSFDRRTRTPALPRSARAIDLNGRHLTGRDITKGRHP
ncbi:MAG: transposase [Gammaproteobacteria bacterium]|nr:transposase [Gammaproteobacteria bacterium]